MKLRIRNMLFSILVIAFINVNSQCWRVIDGGYEFSMALRSDGSIWTTGANGNDGTLGNGTTTTSINKFAPIVGNNNWSAIAAGGYHSLAIRSDGSLWAWGWNIAGQLGVGTFLNSNVPVQVGTSFDWISVTAGYDFSLGLKNDGTIWAWGDNTAGQLGTGTFSASNVPVQVGSANDWKKITAGRYSCFAIKADGTLWAWGYNLHSQLGNNSTTNVGQPVQIGNDNNWKIIAGGYMHTLGLRNDSTLWGWGENASGEVGDGTNSPKGIPVQIGNSKWLSISAGDYHSWGVKAGHTLWSWGGNGNGTLSDGTYNDKNSPNQISADTTWRVVGTGYYHGMAIKINSELYTGGWNSSGQLGIGLTSYSSPTLTSINCNPTGFQELENKQEVIFMYPNPAVNIVNFPDLAEGTFKHVMIEDLTGRCLFEGDVTDKSVDVEELVPGIYFLVVNSAKENSRFKFIKQ